MLLSQAKKAVLTHLSQGTSGSHLWEWSALSPSHSWGRNHTKGGRREVSSRKTCSCSDTLPREALRILTSDDDSELPQFLNLKQGLFGAECPTLVGISAEANQVSSQKLICVGSKTLPVFHLNHLKIMSPDTQVVANGVGCFCNFDLGCCCLCSSHLTTEGPLFLTRPSTYLDFARGSVVRDREWASRELTKDVYSNFPPSWVFDCRARTCSTFPYSVALRWSIQLSRALRVMCQQAWKDAVLYPSSRQGRQD